MNGTASAKFSLGRVLATPGALEAFQHTGESTLDFLHRHASGDWGEMSDADKRENEFALGERLRIFSGYRLQDGTKIWIITEADRSSTTILLPEEY